MLDEIVSERVQPTLVAPTFVTDHPRDISPLAKAKRGNPDVVERFELIVAGMEIANASLLDEGTELVDGIGRVGAPLVRLAGDERHQHLVLTRDVAVEERVEDRGDVVAEGFAGVGIDAPGELTELVHLLVEPKYFARLLSSLTAAIH